MLVRSRFVILALFLFIARVSWAKAPAWTTQNTLTRNGNELRVVCQGQGPDLALARRSSLANCRTTAAEFLTGKFKTQSLSIETEKSVSYHQAVEANTDVSGLTCNPKNEYSEKSDGLVNLFLLCSFDVSNVATKFVVESEPRPSATSETISLVPDKDRVTAVPAYTSDSAPREFVQSENRALLVSVLPRNCSDILVKGDRPRIIKCESPTTVVVHPGDKTLIVRADGFKPKQIEINKPTPSGVNMVERLDVFLER